jgi:hypothetical protein
MTPQVVAIGDFDGGDGPTANDNCDADPSLQNYPALTSAKSGSTTTIQGSLNSTPRSAFTIDFYSSATAGPGAGEGVVVQSRERQ